VSGPINSAPLECKLRCHLNKPQVTTKCRLTHPVFHISKCKLWKRQEQVTNQQISQHSGTLRRSQNIQRNPLEIRSQNLPERIAGTEH
jgi:hypothetical protein